MRETGSDIAVLTGPAPSAQTRSVLDRIRLTGILGIDVVLLLALVLVTLGPIAYLLLQSVNGASLGQPFRLDLSAWPKVITDPDSIRALVNSAVLALRTFPGALIALAISWCLVRLELRSRSFVELTLWFVLFLPSIPMTLSWVWLLNEQYGVLNQLVRQLGISEAGIFSIYSLSGITWVHMGLSTVPYTALLLLPAVRRLDSAFEEAARVSGARPAETFLFIICPLLAQAVLATVIASYVKGLGAFEIEQFLGAPAKIYVLSTELFSYAVQEPPRMAEAMVLGVVAVIAVIVLGGLQALARRRYRSVPTMRAASARTAIRLARRPRLIIEGLLILYCVVTVYLPLAVLLMGSFNTIFGFFSVPRPWTLRHWTAVLTNPDFTRSLMNSILIGGVAALVALPAYLRLGWLSLRRPIIGSDTILLLVWLPWAIPGFVFGLSLLDLMLNVGPFGVFYGSIAPIILIIVVKELPLAVHMFRNALSQLNPHLEEAAEMSGAGPARTFTAVTLPMLRPAMISVFVLILLAAVHEIGSIVLIAAPGTETVSLLMFGYARAGRVEAAAVIGVLQAVAALGVAVLVTRRIRLVAEMA